MAKRQIEADFDAKGFPLAPLSVSKTCWLYGAADGLTVVQEERDYNGEHVRTLQHLIPWHAVDKARGK